MTEFESVYRTYFRDVELYLRAICKDESLAEELTEQVFFQALKALPKFRGECDIRTWLCGRVYFVKEGFTPFAKYT